MGTPIPITLIVAPRPTINPRCGLVVGRRAPLRRGHSIFPHRRPGGHAEYVGGAEAPWHLIRLSIHLPVAHKYIRGQEGSSLSLLLPSALQAFAMARRGTQASGPSVLDFAPSTADGDVAVGVAEKLVLAGIVLR
jgi:hypothetical protein